MSADQPFVLRGGDSLDAAQENRRNAFARIKFLTNGISLESKSQEYLRALDLELWKRWYRGEDMNKRIDEEWCRRTAEVILAMEGKPFRLDEKEFSDAVEEYERKREILDGDEHVEGDSGHAGETEQVES